MRRHYSLRPVAQRQYVSDASGAAAAGGTPHVAAACAVLQEAAELLAQARAVVEERDKLYRLYVLERQPWASMGLPGALPGWLAVRGGWGAVGM